MKKNQTIIAGETVLVPVGELKGYDKNPRKGNIQAIAQSLEINKQYRPIVVQQSTKKILAGNHTWKAAKSLGWSEIAVVFVDVNDEEAKRIVLADNRTNDLADYDGQILAELLRDLGTSEGTGYSASDMDALLKNLDEDLENVMEVTNEAGERVLAENDALLTVSNSLGSVTNRQDYDGIDFEEDEDEKSDIENKPDDLAGVYTLKDDMSFQGEKYWGVPIWREDMMIEELPEPLHTWAGSATRDLDWDGHWLYNWGIDSTSGMKDLSKIFLSFYCWDEYFESWWDNPSRHMSKVLHSKIKYAISPNFSQGDMPKAVQLYQLFRSRWIGRYLQEIGVRVMPDLEMSADKEILRVSAASLPKVIPWASLQVQNITGQTRTGQKETPEDWERWVSEIDALLAVHDIRNLLIYASPKKWDKIKDALSKHNINLRFIETRMHYLSQKVKSNSKDPNRL